MTAEERYDFLLDPDPSPKPDQPGADMADVFRLLLRYGLDPNAVSEGETLLDSILYCCNGYASADTVQVLLDYGADPLLKPEHEESVFASLDFDVVFDSFEQYNRRCYDAMIHCWFVLIAHMKNRYEGEDIVTVYRHPRTDNELPPFQIEHLKDHRNYGWCLTNVPGRGSDWSLHIFDRRTGWEVARL